MTIASAVEPVVHEKEKKLIFGHTENDPIYKMAVKLGRVFREGEHLPEGPRGIDSATKHERGKYEAKRLLRKLTQKMYGQQN